MDALLDIFEYQGEGYQPLIDFGTWRVAFLRYLDELYPPAIDSFERHLETDEVFVLIGGQAVLFTAGDDMQHMGVNRMEPRKLYNVRQGCWHGVVLSRDATILLVENKDTKIENSQYVGINAQQKARILEAARELPDWKNIETESYN